MRTITIFVEHGIIVKYTMMAKPMETLELHYPVIQFLEIALMKLKNPDDDVVTPISTFCAQ